MKKRETTRVVVYPGYGLMLLGVILLVLKLSNTIDWSWWLVLLPFYFYYALAFSFVIAVAALCFFAWIVCAVLVLAEFIQDGTKDLWNYFRGK